MTIKTRLIRAVVGMLIGAALTGMLAALFFFAFVFFYMSQGGDYSERAPWALFAGMAGGMYGYVAGLILGLFLGFMHRGRAFGAVSGAVLGVAVIGAIIVFGDPPKWNTPEAIFCAAIIPVTMLSGLSVSLVVSAITPVTRQRHKYEWLSLDQVMFRLEQNAAAGVLDGDDNN